ncbi:hypothetical protein N0V94_007173 [Neodidymelliopsis sp. IMI 364377]|nr:hypothetical protein N0V94_007173 [Neodidymelliopsis sp. IMI 364377]
MMWDSDDFRTEEARKNVGPGQRGWLETSVLEKVVMKKCSEYAIDEDEAKEMLDKIKIGFEEDVILALLIANCPNLSSLDMGHSQYQLYSVFGAMLERVGKRVKPFGRIPVNLHDRKSLKATKSLHATAFAVPIDVMVRGNHHNHPNFPDHLAGRLQTFSYDHGLRLASGFKRSEIRNMLWKALPVNLEQLWIARAEHQHKEPTGEAQQHFIPDCLLPAIECLVHQKAIVFPQLKELRVEIPPRRWKPEWFESLAAICTTAEVHGIQCTVILTEEVQNSDDYVERRWGWDEDVVWGWTYLNQGPPKEWITARNEENLAEVMKSVQGQTVKV